MRRGNGKRSLEDILNKSDSEDEDYSDHPAPRSRARKSSKAASTPRKKSSQPSKKRRRRNSAGIVSDDDSLEETDDDLSIDESDASSDDPTIPRNARGTARRRTTTRQTQNYEESPDDDSFDDEANDDRSDDQAGVDEEDEPDVGTPTPKKQSIVTLKISAPALEATTRRMTRRTRDPSEDIVELSNSGRHAQTVEQGTVSPEAQGLRRTSGGRTGSKQPFAHQENGNGDVDMEDGVVLSVVPESENGDANHEVEDDEDEDEEPVRASRTRAAKAKPEPEQEVDDAEVEGSPPSRRTGRKKISQSSQRKGQDESDFEPEDEDSNEDEDDASDYGKSKTTSRKNSQPRDDETYITGGRTLRKRPVTDSPQSAALEDELADELAELKGPDARRRRRAAAEENAFKLKPRRNVQPVNYNQWAMLKASYNDEDGEGEIDIAAAKSPSRGGGRNGNYRTLMPIAGPFGGGLFSSIFDKAASDAPGAVGGADSDSSEDEAPAKPVNAANAGQKPTEKPTAGAPANFGKVEKKAMADLDPLGVDMNINFDSVGGLQGHIDQLKEMIFLPLLYPEVFQRFHIVPPRGVLFHGPPGTGKTLMARALASSVSTEGRQVNFYMRKGADTLSKWIGEAERQLRLLFEEARKNQPSIIFFDEIDGLAPVRSSKQEQIHSTIVATLLALMDGMDGRGQVIIIGATNRPDSVDPALRRPGRFDREFYFPLPSIEGRRAILDIHTKGWDPALPDDIKDHLAKITKGYGGADLRALCTEAALNAVQRKYPQIYKSDQKLVIDPKKIDILPKDFMIAIKKMVPSSERSTSSGASALPKSVEPLLRRPLAEIEKILADIIPQRKLLTALEEAQFEEPDDGKGFQREQMMQDFDRSRVFRPRILIRGSQGMGQQYIAAAMLHHFEGLHVQAFDLPTLLSDSTRSPEATVIQLFAEVKRQRPSVIYIPNIQSWAATVGPAVISTFLGLLRSIPPTDPVLLLGVLETADEEVDPMLLKHLFGYSTKNLFELGSPDHSARHEFFSQLIEYVKTPPVQFPDPENRKKRKLEELEVAPPPPPKPPAPLTKAELKAQKRKDRQFLNQLKIRIQPVMDQIKRYKKFRSGPISDEMVSYLFDEADPYQVTSDLPPEEQGIHRPYERGVDKHGAPVLVHVATGKHFYNVDIVMMEKRLSNGYYMRPSDFLADIKRITKDALNLGDADRILRARELQANVEVDMATIENDNPLLVAECEAIYQRELVRKKEEDERTRQAQEQAREEQAREEQQQQEEEAKPDGDGDLEMSNSGDGDISGSKDTETSSFGPSAQPKPPYSHTAPSQQVRRESGMYGNLSQNGPMTPMAPGSQPGDYTNEASTTQTTSYKKSSEHSSNQQDRQHSPTPRHDYPDLTQYPDRVSQEEHLPDTQQGGSSQPSPNAQSSASHSQFKPNPPLFDDVSKPAMASLNSLLHEEPAPKMTIDLDYVEHLHNQLSQQTSGCSIEQLEQIHTCLMDFVWRMRGEWDRTVVAKGITATFNDVLEDMQQVQEIGPISHNTKALMGNPRFEG